MDKTNVFIENGSLIKVENIAEYSWAFCNTLTFIKQ